MKQEVKQQWLAALRGPEYTQGHTKLRTGLGFCCLGVLCDLFIKLTGKGVWEAVINPDEEGGKYFKFIDSYGVSHTTVLPAEVSDWAGLSDNRYPYNPKVEEIHGTPINLGTLNDGAKANGYVNPVIVERRDFHQIAGKIEAAL